MGLLQEWRDVAYSQETDKKQLQKFWTDYFFSKRIFILYKISFFTHTMINLIEKKTK